MFDKKNVVDEGLMMQLWVDQGLALKQGEESTLELNKYHFTEWVLGPDTLDRKNKLKIKAFNNESYNGPRLEDFLDRLDALYETALVVIDKKEDSVENKEQLKQNISHYKELAKKKLIEDCQIEAILLDNILEKEGKVIKKIEQAAQHLQYFLAHALPVIYPDESLKDAVNKFQKAEAQWTADQGRPDFINTYQLGEATRISAQRVVGDSIIPSTKRDDGKLPNFVQVAIGSVDLQGQTDVEFTGYRHSSYPPIKVKDKIERRALACQAVKDMLTELARQQLQGQDPSKFNSQTPLELNLSSMALLSPIQGDKIHMGDESEHRQLKESQYALMMYNNRGVKLKVNDQEIIVKPQITLMNQPANFHGVMLKKVNQNLNALGLSPDLEETINTKGMYSFTKDANDHIHDQINQLRKTQLFDNDENVKEIFNIYEQISAAYGQSGDLDKAQKDLNKLLNSDELENAYEELEQKQEVYLNNKSKTEKDDEIDYEKEYFNQVKKVREIESRYHKAYKDVENERKKVWSANKDQIIDLNNKLVTYLGDANNQKKMKSDVEHGKSLKKLLKVMQLYHQAESMHFNENTEPQEFASRFLLVNQFMGKSVDWFCKSGEDRTGRLHNFIEELCGFSSQNGYFPDYSFTKDEVLKQDRDEQQEIAKTVLEFSVSRDICGENAHGARGLQQSETGMKLNADLPNKSGDSIGKLAKSDLYDADLLKKIKLEEKADEATSQNKDNSKDEVISKDQDSPKNTFYQDKLATAWKAFSSLANSAIKLVVGFISEGLEILSNIKFGDLIFRGKKELMIIENELVTKSNKLITEYQTARDHLKLLAVDLKENILPPERKQEIQEKVATVVTKMGNIVESLKGVFSKIEELEEKLGNKLESIKNRISAIYDDYKKIVDKYMPQKEQPDEKNKETELTSHNWRSPCSVHNKVHDLNSGDSCSCKQSTIDMKDKVHSIYSEQENIEGEIEEEGIVSKNQ